MACFGVRAGVLFLGMPGGAVIAAMSWATLPKHQGEGQRFRPARWRLSGHVFQLSATADSVGTRHLPVRSAVKSVRMVDLSK
jgi:hypothetical protein